MMNMPINNISSIANFNKIFDQNMKDFSENFNESSSDFDKVLNQQSMAIQNQMPEMASRVSGGVELNVGLENIGITPFQSIMEQQSGEVQKSSKNMSVVEKTAGDFGRALSSSVNSINDSQIKAETAAEIMASGGDISAHEVMIATEKAALALQMGIQVRNRIVQAYNELREVRI